MKTKRIVISTENGQVAQHFGRCSQFTVVDIEDAKLKAQRTIPNPGHAPGALPEYFKQLGCQMIIAGGMGRRAQQFLKDYGIEWMVGVQGRIEDVIADYLNGKLESGESLCLHGKGKGDGHHHHH